MWSSIPQWNPVYQLILYQPIFMDDHPPIWVYNIYIYIIQLLKVKTHPSLLATILTRPPSKLIRHRRSLNDKHRAGTADVVSTHLRKICDPIFPIVLLSKLFIKISTS